MADNFFVFELALGRMPEALAVEPEDGLLFGYDPVLAILFFHAGVLPNLLFRNNQGDAADGEDHPQDISPAQRLLEQGQSDKAGDQKAP